MMDREHELYKEAIESMLPDREAVRKEALKAGRPEAQAAGHRWLIPVIACVAAVAVICAVIPPVRAAVSQWFSDIFSVQDYMAQPTEARPSVNDIDTVIEQTMPEHPETADSIEITNVVPEWQEWAKNLKPSVGDVFFDGRQLIVSFDMGGGAMELLIGETGAYPVYMMLGNPGYIKLNGEKYAYSVSADAVRTGNYQEYMSDIRDKGVTDELKHIVEQADSVPFSATIDFSRSVDMTAEFDKWGEADKALFLEDMKRVQEYDPEYTPFEFKTPAPGEKLSGVQHVEASLPLMAIDYSKPGKQVNEGVTHESEYIGLVKLSFSFDPQAGNENMKSYDIGETVEFAGECTYAWADRVSDPEYDTCTNKTIDMSGVTMTAKRMDVYAAGAELYVSITCPDTWEELDKQSFIGSLIPQIKGDGADVPASGIQFGLAEQGEDEGMCIHLDLLPSEIESIDTFEILPVLSRFTGYDGVPYVEGEPTRIKKEDVTGWQEDSKELVDCALKFSLK
jgi:hypothetical protein